MLLSGSKISSSSSFFISLLYSFTKFLANRNGEVRYPDIVTIKRTALLIIGVL